jgi:hypothetical protein
MPIRQKVVALQGATAQCFFDIPRCQNNPLCRPACSAASRRLGSLLAYVGWSNKMARPGGWIGLNGVAARP